MTAKSQSIPLGFHTITPHLVLREAARGIEFYRTAFGAEEMSRMSSPNGQGILHAVLKIGDSLLMLCDEFPQMSCFSPQHLKGTPVAIHLYVDNVDQWFDRAVAAGAAPVMPPREMFWGDRYGRLVDPFGHQWSLATHKFDPTPEEMQKGAAEVFTHSG